MITEVFFQQKTGMLVDIPSGKRANITNWKDPPCYSWENQLFRLGHVPVRYVTVILPEGHWENWWCIGIWQLSPKFSDNTKYDQNFQQPGPAKAHHFGGTSWGPWIQRSLINSSWIGWSDISLRRCWSSKIPWFHSFFAKLLHSKKDIPGLVNEFSKWKGSTMLFIDMGQFTQFFSGGSFQFVTPLPTPGYIIPDPIPASR